MAVSFKILYRNFFSSILSSPDLDKVHAEVLVPAAVQEYVESVHVKKVAVRTLLTCSRHTRYTDNRRHCIDSEINYQQRSIKGTVRMISSEPPCKILMPFSQRYH